MSHCQTARRLLLWHERDDTEEAFGGTGLLGSQNIQFDGCAFFSHLLLTHEAVL